MRSSRIVGSVLRLRKNLIMWALWKSLLLGSGCACDSIYICCISVLFYVSSVPLEDYDAYFWVVVLC